MLRALSNWLSKASTGKLLENINKLVQVVAILIGAGWAYKEFLDYSRENQKLTLDQLRLSIRQAGINVSLQEDSRFSLTMKIGVEGHRQYDDDTTAYRVLIDAAVQNISGKPLDVVACVVVTHLASPSLVELLPNTALWINAPPSMDGKIEPGPLAWQRLTASGYYFEGRKPQAQQWLNLAKPSIQPDRVFQGGCAARHSPGGTVNHSEEMWVRAKPTDVFGASMYLHVPSDPRDGRPTARHEWVILGPAADNRMDIGRAGRKI